MCRAAGLKAALICVMVMGFTQVRSDSVFAARFLDRIDESTAVAEMYPSPEDYEGPVSSVQNEYDDLCAQVPDKPMPAWRCLLNKWGSAILVRLLAIKNFFVSRYDRLKTWIKIQAMQRVRRERAQ